MKRIYVGLVFALLLSASLTAQQRFAPPKVSTLPTACNVGDIVNLTTGTVGDYVCTAANTWSATPLSGGAGSITCADTGVVFASAANVVGCDIAKLVFDDATSTLKVQNIAYAAPGADLTITSPPDDLTHNAGDLNLQGYSATLATNQGGDVHIDGGDALVSGRGGNIRVRGGDATDGNAGIVEILSGFGTGSDGYVIVNGCSFFLQNIECNGGGTLSNLGNLAFYDGGAVQPDTTTAHTATLKAYDNDTGPGYVTFATLTNGNSPSFVIAPPAGGATVSVTGRHVAAGATPSVANVGANSCGTDAATIAGNDNTGIVTVGATSGTQCRITFTVAAATRWQCVVNNESTANLARTTYVDTTHVDLKGVFVAGDVLSYICMPR